MFRQNEVILNKREMETNVRETIKQLVDFNPEAKLSVVLDGKVYAIEDFGWAVSGGDGSSENRNIAKEKANATFVYINCDKPEN